MSRPAPTAAPVLTVRYEGTARDLAAGNDAVIGRDLRADIRIGHPLVSRAHVVVRFDQGRWVAIDNGSLNGMYQNGRRVPTVDIYDGQSLNIGNPDGPQLRFEVGRKQGAVGRPPQNTSAPPSQRLRGGGPPQPPSQPIPRQGFPPQPSGPQQRGYPPSGPVRQPGYPAGGQPPYPPKSVHNQPQYSPDATQMGPAAQRPDPSAGKTGLFKRPPAVGLKIGRATDNDVVIPDVLASRHHATLVSGPGGTSIQDNRSINGTFVNGRRVDSELLKPGDVVTIGNVDLVFDGTSLSRRTETEAATKTGGLEVHGVVFTVDHGKVLLDSVSFSARPGTLTALIGPSGAGKSTLAKLIAGYTQPSAGAVTFEGHNIHAEYASLRSRIGMVPQDDVVHGQLTVRQALMYAAELRLPPDTNKADREQVVMQVLEELEMIKHLDTRVDKLSGGQRKRASVALELLTGPSLLILDEPTSGLDPALDRQVMTMLRNLADAGRVVLVVTHSLSYLDVCDQVLLLGPGGKTAFSGAPAQIGAALGTTNWADIFSSVAADPDGAKARWLAKNGPPPPPPKTETPSEAGDPTHTSLVRQFSTISRRQIRLIVSDRGYFIFLALLPFIMGALSLSVPGDTGFGQPDPRGEAPNQPGQILVLLNVGAIFMGTALTIRDLIGERAIFLREQAVGLSTTAYLLAKICIYSVFAIVQSGIVTLITLIGVGPPQKGANVLGNASLELFVGMAACTVCAATVGLALSALARTSDQIMPLLVVAIMSQLVFSGGMIPVTGRVGLDQLSWITPARWGFAVTASTVGLTELVKPPIVPDDSLWKHGGGTWLFNMAMLAALSVFYLGFVRWKIRLK
ncbi:MAG: ATP-binding cassette domain-containing protein [Mycobacterium sp.]